MQSFKLLILALNLGLANTYYCQIGTETCLCEYIDCRKYSKSVEYCDTKDYKEQDCNTTDYYIYPAEFCNLTSITCLEKVKAGYGLNFSSLAKMRDRLNLTISFKYISTVALDWFKNLNVTYLDLSCNRIALIQKDALSKTIGLRELRMSINNLTNIELGKLPDLELLDISRNWIESIESNTFSSMPKLKVLRLDFNNIKFIPSDAFDSNAELKNIGLKQNCLEELNPFSPQLKNVVAIDLDENYLVNLKAKTFKNLRSLKILRIRYNLIKTVDNTAFNGLTNLRKFRLASNQLSQVVQLNESFNLRLFAMVINVVTVIDRKCFANFKNLAQLNMSLNKIERIDDFSFNISSLTIYLDLSGNFITRFNSSNVFYGLSNLKLLSLRNNRLPGLLQFTFMHLTGLITLTLEENLIENIQNNSFFGLTSLKSLSLRSNQLKRLNKSGFWYLTSVTTLELDANQIYTIEEGAFLGMNSLSVIKLNDNKLQFLKNSFFSGLTWLNELYLSNNQISSIQVESFHTLRSLILLDLNDNNIFKLDPMLLLNLDSLKKLYLQHNVIHSITNQTFKYVRYLIDLNLGYNFLTILNPGVFSCLSKLERLNLELNPIKTINFDGFFGLNQLVYLKLENEIRDVQFNMYTSGKETFLPKLKSIFFKRDKAKLVEKFDLASITTISLNYCSMDLKTSRMLTLNKIENIYMRKLDLVENTGLNYYLSEFGDKLLEIDLSFNLIEFKNPNQFISKSKNLQSLWLAGVNITRFNTTLDLSLFSNLFLLDLSHNRLEIIEESYFKFNYELMYLNLSHNRIRIVQDYALFNNEKLTVLYLSYNKIEYLNEEVFPATLTNLSQLCLNNNKLKEFNAECRLQSSFDVIQLDNNNLPGIPTTIYYYVMYLNELSMNGNPIGLLQPEFFSITSRIFILNLRNCSIFNIANDTFGQVHTLIFLDLSVNSLEYLENNFFNGVESLQNLKLDSNKIAFIQKELFQNLTRLMYLDLTNNLIRDIEDGSFLGLNSLLELKIEYNPIIDLFKNLTFFGLSKLKYISVPKQVIFTEEISQSIVGQIRLRLRRQVLNMSFYDLIEIQFLPDFDETYSSEVCFNIMFLLRNQISLNIEGELRMAKFIIDCKEWSNYEFKLNNKFYVRSLN